MGMSDRECPMCHHKGCYQEYDNGGYCFSCNKPNFNSRINDSTKEVKMELEKAVPFAEIKSLVSYGLPHRGISQEAAEKYGVKTEFNEATGVPSKVYFPYYRGSVLVGYKVVPVDSKKFYTVGNIKGADLFGQNMVGDSGQMIIVTEGEYDTLAAHQMLQKSGKGSYKVVSLPRGANLASVKDNLEYLEKFKTVVLNFDNDPVGQELTEKVKELFTPGKIKVMKLPEKDANDMITKNHSHVEYLRALNAAQTHRPDGIISGEDTWLIMQDRPKKESIPYPETWDLLNKMTYGIRTGELDTWTAGSGSGKTQILRELEYHLLQTTDQNMGIIALEEPLEDSVEAIMSLHMNQRIHLPDVREKTTEDERYKAWLATVGTNRMHFYDHFGSVDDDSLVYKIRYMVHGLGCKYIFLDHLSIVVSEFASEGGERERIDTIMTRLKKLTQELDIWIGLVVHLRKTTGGSKSFEQGAMPDLDDLRGSGSIKQLSNSVYASARDQQHPDETKRNTSQIAVLKCRFSGRTGNADELFFEGDTGRMVKTESQEFLVDKEF